MHASLAVEQDSEWVVENKGHSKNVKSTKQIVLLEEVLPLTARELWELIFSHGFQQSFHDRVRDTDCQIGTWHLEGTETPNLAFCGAKVSPCRMLSDRLSSATYLNFAPMAHQQPRDC